ncbi:MAG: hypothetical protein O9248_00500 [Rhodobacteraceae bacterium]|nr:hypothetical protein [Paracoccaceae bacterium]
MHPAGHQTKLAARYLLPTQDGDRIALMFEKGPSSPAYLWMRSEHATRMAHLGISRREYPAADLYAATDGKGRPVYGRHAALRQMRELANADLVRFEVEQVSQLQALPKCLGQSGGKA